MIPTPLRLPAVAPRPPLPAGPYLIAGLRVAGRSALRALAERAGDEQVLVWDEREHDDVRELARSVVSSGGRASVGGDGTELLGGDPAPRCVVKSPGVPPDAPLMRAARDRGLEIMDEAEVGWRLEGRPFVAVTGTNGKGTSVALVRAILEQAGVRPVVAGNTTFGPPLTGARDLDGELVLAELSSFQLEGSPRLLPEAALLTNLTHEHWDYHGGHDGYARAKRRLFVREHAVVEVAALNVDDALGRSLAAEVAARGGTVVTYARDAEADVRLLAADWDLDGASLRVVAQGVEREQRVRLPGEHNAMNAVGALALAAALGVDERVAASGLARAQRPPGRFELVARAEPCDVVVDYAHNADGVRQTLRAARQHLERSGGDGRLIVVASMLWTYPPDQRTATGRALGEAADVLVLTTMRWRPDEPPHPPDDFVTAATATGASPEVIDHRGHAIERAIEHARAGDVVVVCGRGEGAGALYHEGEPPAFFDDRVAARDAIRRTRERSA
jgi:UDP-N-acetylmuramoylalanine-D-glutamate ligase